MKGFLKTLAMVLGGIPALPLALCSAFGRFRPVFKLGSHLYSLAPGIIGDYIRLAYYGLTLRSCSAQTRVSFGTVFSTPDVVLEPSVYIGSFCVIGRSRIGARTQIADHVQILSGSRQHLRDEQGNITGAESGIFEQLTIGSDCWIGAAAIVMANVGRRSTVGAGSIVTKELPDGVVAAGNPARVIRTLTSAESPTPTNSLP